MQVNVREAEGKTQDRIGGTVRRSKRNLKWRNELKRGESETSKDTQ